MNPWTDAYFEELFQCSMTPGSGRYQTSCDGVLSDIPRAPRYHQDPYVIYTINAVFGYVVVYRDMYMYIKYNLLQLLDSFLV